MAQNYQIILDNTIKKDLLCDKPKRLLLHACCAPCSSYCIEYLASVYEIVIYYYNPNITNEDEYHKREMEIVKFVNCFNDEHLDKCVEGDSSRKYKKVEVKLGHYDTKEFFDVVKGMEKLPEGSQRCYKCYELRLDATAKIAVKNEFDYFTTTLSISPYKRAQWLNEIGAMLSEKYNVAYLFSDFKKKNGYKRSIELSAQYGLYRQNFCGCIYSQLEVQQKLSQQQ